MELREAVLKVLEIDKRWKWVFYDFGGKEWFFESDPPPSPIGAGGLPVPTGTPVIYRVSKRSGGVRISSWWSFVRLWRSRGSPKPIPVEQVTGA